MKRRTLKDWAVFECQWPKGTGAPTRHLVGTCLGEARCSSAVVIDIPARSGISTKGNIYALLGEPGLRLHAIFLWHAFVESNRPVSVREITEELFPDLVAQLNGPESVPGSTVEEASIAMQGAGDGELAENKDALQSAADSSFLVEGEVVEVLAGIGLAHVRAANGLVYGLNRKTPGIAFDALQAGQRVQCQVAAKFHRVLHAALVP